jgi:hypothetical protein
MAGSTARPATTSTSVFGARPMIAPAAPGAGEVDPTPPFGGGGGGGGGGFRPQTSPSAGPMAAGIFGTPAGTFRPAASADEFAPEAADGAVEPLADDGGFSDEDILELGDPMDASPQPQMDLPEPVVAELPLAPPTRLELPEAEQRAAAAEEPQQAQRRQTLFERMMDLARKPKAEEPPVETLAPEPEVDEDADETRIPPFMRRQRN